jgi:GTP-binding protein HflX
VDSSESKDTIDRKVASCLETIERIEASGIPMIRVFNKIDLLPEGEIERRWSELKRGNSVFVSALHGTNFDFLKEEIFRKLKNTVKASFTVPVTSEAMSFVSWLFNHTFIRDMKYVDGDIHISFEAIPRFAEKVRKLIREDFRGEFTMLKRADDHGNSSFKVGS